MDAKQKRIGSFLLLAFGISWSIAAIGIALGASSATPIGYLVMAALFMFGPALAAIIQQRSLDHAPWSGLGVGLKGVLWGQVVWTAIIGLAIIPTALLVAWILGDGCGMASFGHVSLTQERMMVSMQELLAAKGGGQQGLLGSALGKMHLPGALWLLIMLASVLVVASTVNLPVMMGEELGWRGYLYQVTAHWPGYKRVLFTGAVWGLWHAPLIAQGHNYPKHPMAGIGLMVVFCILIALLMDRARLRTGMVWSAGLLHGCINGSAGAYMLFAWDGETLVNSPVGLAGFLGIALLGALVLVFDGMYRERFLHAKGSPIGPVEEMSS